VWPDQPLNFQSLVAVAMPPSQLLDPSTLIVVGADLPFTCADFDAHLLLGKVVLGQEYCCRRIVGWRGPAINFQMEFAGLEVETIIVDTAIRDNRCGPDVRLSGAETGSVGELGAWARRLRGDRGVGYGSFKIAGVDRGLVVDFRSRS
jgi:hypothetical protein